MPTLKEKLDVKAALLLTKAIEQDVIDLSSDPLFLAMNLHKTRMEQIRLGCIVTPIVILPYSLYKFSYLKGQSLLTVAIKAVCIFGMFGVADSFSPARLSYYDTFMELAAQRKTQLQGLYDQNKLVLD